MARFAWSAAVVVSVLAVAVTTPGAAPAGYRAACGSSPPAAIQTNPNSAEAVGLDGSPSTAAPELRREYRRAALAAVQTAAAHGSAVRIVVFGASGVGARVIFSGSFAPVSTVYAFNLAARNRLLCLARRALASAFAGRVHGAGTDVAGAVAAQVAWGRSVVGRHGRVSVLVLTDGCQAPSPSGPNSDLTDVCGQLRADRRPAWILRRHRAEFSFGRARGVQVRMEGVGVGRHAAAASTVQAEELVRFWLLVCRRSRAVCRVGSAVQ